MRRRSRSNAGPTASPRARRVALHPTFRFSGASGISPRTRRRQRACLRICRNRLRSRRLVVASDGYDLPAFPKLTTLKTWAESRTAEGHPLPLSKSVQSPDAIDLGIARSAEDCPTDLYAGDPDEDVRAFLSRRSHGEFSGLGGGEPRRLHPELRTKGHRRDAAAASDRGPRRRIRLHASASGSRRHAGSRPSAEIGSILK